MKRGIIMVVAAFVVVAGMVCVFAQDRPPAGDPGGFGRPGARDRGEAPERPGRAQRPFSPRQAGGPVVMELSGDTMFLVQGTVVYKVDTRTMELKASKDLGEEGASGDAEEEVIRKFDRDGDGLISPDEWPGPEGLFRELDADGSGTLSKSELPQELVERAKRSGRTGRLPAGAAAIKVGDKNLFVYLGGHLFKMKISDLAVEGKLALGQEVPERPTPTDEERRRRKMEKREREKQGRPEEDSGKPGENDKDDDFGF